MTQTLHIEIARKVKSTLKRNEIFQLAKAAVDRFGNPVRDFCIHDSANLHLVPHVDSVKFCVGVRTLKTCQSDPEKIPWERKCHSTLSTYSAATHANRIYHFFKLAEEGDCEENLEGESQESSSSQKTSRHSILPSREFYQEWDGLVIAPEVKSRLVDYIRMVYSTYQSTQQEYSDGPSSSIWSKIILMHGPPGTGKTTLCKAFANKATIRLGHLFDYGQLVEINSQHLFSKYFSETGNLIVQMFTKIRDLLEDPKSIVFLHIDEVESLACDRTSVCPNRDGDTLRAVNCLLAQLDNIKVLRNLVILTTSNLVSLIDVAFVDRADLKLFIGNPDVELIYEMYVGSLNELIRVGFIREEDGDENYNKVHLMPPTMKHIDAVDQNYSLANKLFNIAMLSSDMSGRTLKRIPFLTHCSYIKSTDGRCTLFEFLEAMHMTVRAEKKEVDLQDVKFFIPCKNQYLAQNSPWIRNRKSPNSSASMDQEQSTSQILSQTLTLTSPSSPSSVVENEVSVVCPTPPENVEIVQIQKPPERSPIRSRSPTPEIKSPSNASAVSTLSGSMFNIDQILDSDPDADIDMMIEDPLSVDNNEINREIPGLELTFARETTPESNQSPLRLIFEDESEILQLSPIFDLESSSTPPLDLINVNVNVNVDQNQVQNQNQPEEKSVSPLPNFKCRPTIKPKTKIKPQSKSNVSSSSSFTSSSISESSSTYSLKIHEEKPKKAAGKAKNRGRGRPPKRPKQIQSQSQNPSQSQQQRKSAPKNPKPRKPTARKRPDLLKANRKPPAQKPSPQTNKNKKIPESLQVEENDRRRSSRLSGQSSREKQTEEKVEMNYDYFQEKNKNPEVEVRESEIPDAGRGLFAMRDFYTGDFLTEYGGELLSRKDGIEREREYELAEKSLYLFFFAHDGRNYCIDAMDCGSLGRFVNHSKARQNARVKRVTVNGIPKLYFEASKTIEKNEEILYDYGVTRREVLKQLPWLKF